jgi:lactoylglutathione lyase
MLVESCIPVIPSADLEKSLRFWVGGLGLSMDRPMRQDGRLVGCMVHNERLYFWLNQRAGSPIKPENYEGIRLYWAPGDIKALRERLLQLGYSVSEIVERDYGQTEFFVTDDDGYSHCFGVATNEKADKGSAGHSEFGCPLKTKVVQGTDGQRHSQCGGLWQPEGNSTLSGGWH